MLRPGIPPRNLTREIAERIADHIASAKLMPGARIVRAFNAISYRRVGEIAHRPGGLVGVPIAGVLAGLFAIPVILLLSRLRGAYFTIGSWVIADILQQVFLQVGKIQGKLLYSVVYRAGADLQPGRIVGKFPEWSRDDHSCHIVCAFFR